MYIRASVFINIFYFIHVKFYILSWEDAPLYALKPTLSGHFLSGNCLKWKYVHVPWLWGWKMCLISAIKRKNLSRNGNQIKHLYGKFPVFRNASFRRLLGILYILQHFVSPNSCNLVFNGTALPVLKINWTVCSFRKFYSARALGLHFYFSLTVVVPDIDTREKWFMRGSEINCLLSRSWRSLTSVKLKFIRLLGENGNFEVVGKLC
jgi:hypothetical protein